MFTTRDLTYSSFKRDTISMVWLVDFCLFVTRLCCHWANWEFFFERERCVKDSETWSEEQLKRHSFQVRPCHDIWLETIQPSWWRADLYLLFVCVSSHLSLSLRQEEPIETTLKLLRNHRERERAMYVSRSILVQYNTLYCKLPTYSPPLRGIMRMVSFAYFTALLTYLCSLKEPTK